jgi:hypothetical protein
MSERIQFGLDHEHIEGQMTIDDVAQAADEGTSEQGKPGRSPAGCRGSSSQRHPTQDDGK